MIYQSDLHKHRFELYKQNLKKPSNRTIAALYLLTSDDSLWAKVKRQMQSSRLDFEKTRLGGVSSDSYALWKAAREMQSGEKQISLCELSDAEVISDRVFHLIVQAMTIRLHRHGQHFLEKSK